MINKIFRLYILFALFFTAGVFAFADEPGLVLNGKHSVDTAAAGKQAEKDYGQALELYKNKKLAKAKKKFKEVSLIIPDYKSTQYYLSKIDDEIKEAQAESLRQEALAQERQRVQKRQQELKAEAQKRREEFLRQQTQERQERQRLASLEVRRKAVRKQLEEGVEAMYQEALSLYKQGDYTAAANKFKDVQDILPEYKRAGQYMDEARLKSLTVNPPPPSASRQDTVLKALDLLESNAK